MNQIDRFIASCRSWDDFWDRARKSTDAEKGRAFERLTQLYLKTAPEYQTKLQDVWLLRDVPADVRRRLNLPGPRDEGIDLIACTRQGKYWAIQAIAEDWDAIKDQIGGTVSLNKGLWISDGADVGSLDPRSAPAGILLARGAG
jgi:predicted helicase